MYLLGEYLRYGVRLLRKSPGFTAIALVTLALGIGATTAIFSVVDAVVIKPLPFRDPSRVAIVWEKNAAQNRFRMMVAAANMVAWQRQAHSFSGMAGVYETTLNLTAGPNGRIDPEELNVARVSASLFPLLGVQAALGRTFLPEEDQFGKGSFAVLSDSLWRRKFAADPNINGKNIRLRNTSYQVVGVLPPGFGVLNPADVYLPLAFNANDARMGAARVLFVVARLADGVTLADARKEMAIIGDRLEAGNPALNRGWGPSVFTIQDELYGKAEQAMWVLLGAVGMLLLMACANVANLLLARGAGWQKEIAIRSAMGGLRRHLIAQFLTESLLLSVTGGALGLALAQLGIALVVRFGPATIPRLTTAHLDAPLLLFAALISIGSGLIFGIFPALQGSRANLQLALTENSRGGTAGRASRWLRGALAVAEIALALVVCVGAGLLLRSFERLRAMELGFQPEHALTFRLPMASGRNDAAQRRIVFLDQLLQRLAALPGAQFAGASSTLPLDGMGDGTGYIAGGQAVPGQKPTALLRGTTSGYFRALGIPLVAGRYFSEADTSTSPSVAVINTIAARRLYPNGDALGNKLWMDANERAAEIVGVVGTVKPVRLEDIDWPTIYLPYAQKPDRNMMAALRVSGDPLAFSSAAQRVVREMDAEQPIVNIRPMIAVVDEAVSDSRFNAVALGFFGVLAFTLAAVGIYGVISYDVAARTNEIGIRVALGAQRGQVIRLILRQGATLAAWGVGIGLVCAFALTRFLQSMLFGVDAHDFYTFALIAVLLTMVALLAAYLPSRRAVRLDPVNALRHD